MYALFFNMIKLQYVNIDIMYSSLLGGGGYDVVIAVTAYGVVLLGLCTLL